MRRQLDASGRLRLGLRDRARDRPPRPEPARDQRRVAELSSDDPDDANELSVRTELQADCYAGVWAATVFAEGDLEEGDIDEAFNAAEAVGDDRLQSQAGQRVNPDSFTHGTSEQRRTLVRHRLRVRRSRRLRHLLGRRGLGTAARRYDRAVGFFSRRRKKESAIPESANEQALGSFAQRRGPAGRGPAGRRRRAPINLQSMGLIDGLQALLAARPDDPAGDRHRERPDHPGRAADDRHARHRPARGDHGDHDPARHRPRDRHGEQTSTPSPTATCSSRSSRRSPKHGIDPGASGTSINFQSSDPTRTSSARIGRDPPARPGQAG